MSRSARTRSLQGLKTGQASMSLRPPQSLNSNMKPRVPREKPSGINVSLSVYVEVFHCFHMKMNKSAVRTQQAPTKGRKRSNAGRKTHGRG